MKNKNNPAPQGNKKRIYPIIAILSLILVTSGLFFWASQKEGLYVDEGISYEMANAEYTPWIIPTQPKGIMAQFFDKYIKSDTVSATFSNFISIITDKLKNRGSSILSGYSDYESYAEPVWITSEEFKDYITTDSDDAFNYLSVYLNVKSDTHPPIYYMMVHTVSSIFRGSFVPWLGCIMNIFAILGSCLLFFPISKRLTGDYRYGIIATLLYCPANGVIASAVFVRMYAVLGFCCILSAYLHIRCMQDSAYRKHIVPLILTTVLGFLTQYYFVFFMLGIALTTVILLAVKKDIKSLITYVITMFASAALGIAAFPSCLTHLLSGERGVGTLSRLSGDYSGIGQSLSSFCKYLINGFAGKYIGLALFAVTVILLIINLIRNKVRKSNDSEKLPFSSLCSLLLLVIPPVFYFIIVVWVSPMPADRYIMPVYPFMALIWACLISRLGVSFSRLRFEFIAVAALVLSLASFAMYDGEYLYRGYSSQLAIAEEYSECPLVYVDGYSLIYENLEEATIYSKTLIVSESQLESSACSLHGETSEKIVVLMKYYDDYENVKKILSEEYGYNLEEVLLEPALAAHADTIWLMSK